MIYDMVFLSGHVLVAPSLISVRSTLDVDVDMHILSSNS